MADVEGGLRPGVTAAEAAELRRVSSCSVTIALTMPRSPRGLAFAPGISAAIMLAECPGLSLSSGFEGSIDNSGRTRTHTVPGPLLAVIALLLWRLVEVPVPSQSLARHWFSPAD